MSPEPETIFRCPECHHPLPGGRTSELAEQCPDCGFRVAAAEGLPLLVRDAQAIDRVKESAHAEGRGEWYQDQQRRQLSGPYRHHIRKRREYVIAVLQRHLRDATRPVRGLDLGCGDGVNLSWLAPHFDEVFASDYNLTRLTRARTTTNPDFNLYLADVTDYPVLDDRFDVIFFNHVLEHIPDDIRALSEVRRILKPGGLLILGVPNEGAYFWQLAYRLQPKIRATTDHVHFYTGEDLARKCREAGFRVDEVHPIGWGVPHWTLDAMLRGFRPLDDLFEKLGRALAPTQATSLYLLLSK